MGVGIAWFPDYGLIVAGIFDGRNNWGGDTAQHRKKKLSCGWVGGGWVGGPSQEKIPLRGSILQAGTF